MSERHDQSPHSKILRKGWTTGACAAAASRAAFQALLSGHFPPSVTITLPGGQSPCFDLALAELGIDYARAGIVKDAGDDPDVTHGAMIIAKVAPGAKGAGVRFFAGEGVGTVTRPGLPLAPGEPAINPGPREMIRKALSEVAGIFGVPLDVTVEISIPGGEKIAEQTLNARLGIIGGLSILGTTGIVVPYSCSAWIHTIHRGVDVARASEVAHIAGSTGSTSEQAVKMLYNLPDVALIEMGDFVGGLLKYLRKNPVPRVTLAGGLAKMSKLGQGMIDLHSRRGSVDLMWLAERAGEAGGGAELAAAIKAANSAKEAFDLAAGAKIDLAAGAKIDLAVKVAEAAWQTAAKVLRCDGIMLDVVLFDRDGGLLARTSPRIL